MIVLPRLARFFNQPGIAAILGLVLVAVGILGLVTDDIRAGYAVVILIVGLINVVRAIPPRDAPQSGGP